MPSSRARSPTFAAMTRARSASKRSRAPSPATIQRLPSAWVIARCLKVVFASPESSSACSSPPACRARCPCRRTPRWRRCRRRVSMGAEVVVETCIRRRRLRQYDAPMPKTVILGSARTPIGKLGGGLSTLKATELGGIAISRRARASGRRSRAGRPRRDGPGAPGRPGADPLAPGADRRRHPEGGLLRDDQQGLRLGHARRPASSTRRSAPATSRSASAAAWSPCRRRPTCCRRRASATAWATRRRSTPWSTTG